MIETELQGHLCKAAIAAGGYGFKCSNRFIVGVVDLFIQLPGRIGVWIEVKIRHGVPARGVATLGLTPNQARFIMAMQQAGGRAGWMMGVEVSSGRFLLQCGTDPRSKRFRIGDDVIERGRGQPWPIEHIVDNILRNHPC